TNGPGNCPGCSAGSGARTAARCPPAVETPRSAQTLCSSARMLGLELPLPLSLLAPKIAQTPNSSLLAHSKHRWLAAGHAVCKRFVPAECRQASAAPFSVFLFSCRGRKGTRGYVGSVTTREVSHDEHTYKCPCDAPDPGSRNGGRPDVSQSGID